LWETKRQGGGSYAPLNFEFNSVVKLDRSENDPRKRQKLLWATPEGRFGRVFPNLPGQTVNGDVLLNYGAAGDPIEPKGRRERERER
jgi:hypothetical protein